MNDTTEKYFDLHVNGLGYLNRPREIKVKKGQDFVAVDIAALHGAADDVNYTRFDCRVSGREAESVIRRCMVKMAADEDAKVLIGFRLGDVSPELFTYRSGDKAGEIGVSLKARLLKIHWVRVNGDTVYTAPVAEDPASKDDADNDEPKPDEPVQPLKKASKTKQTA